jgi:hypothetical protein
MSADSVRDAVDKLTRTRLAMVALVERGEQREDGRSSEESDAVRASWLERLERSARSWWRHHPARAGLELATPALSVYAARHPARLLGIAGAAGAVFVAARLWRLIPVTGLLLALVKSSDMSDLLASAMSAAGVARTGGDRDESKQPERVVPSPGEQ